MPEYANKSVEELRSEDYQVGCSQGRRLWARPGARRLCPRLAGRATAGPQQGHSRSCATAACCAEGRCCAGIASPLAGRVQGQHRQRLACRRRLRRHRLWRRSRQQPLWRARQQPRIWRRQQPGFWSQRPHVWRGLCARWVVQRGHQGSWLGVPPDQLALSHPCRAWPTPALLSRSRPLLQPLGDSVRPRPRHLGNLPRPLEPAALLPLVSVQCVAASAAAGRAWLLAVLGPASRRLPHGGSPPIPLAPPPHPPAHPPAVAQAGLARRAARPRLALGPPAARPLGRRPAPLRLARRLRRVRLREGRGAGIGSAVRGQSAHPESRTQAPARLP